MAELSSWHPEWQRLRPVASRLEHLTWTCTSSTAPTSCSATTSRPHNKDPHRRCDPRRASGRCCMLLEEGATHVGVATDHVIESFRNDLWPGYKTSAGMPRELLAQFPLLEEVLVAAGIVTVCRWSSSRPTTRSAPPRRGRRRRRASSGC